MKKQITTALAALALLAACTADTDMVAPQGQLAGGAEAVAFGTFLGNTRAQQTGIMETTTLQSTGFGVFAYHSDASAGETEYNSSSSKPNFMWNQKVEYGTEWGYTPIKYWPNEFGTNAKSTKTDKLSFFAYAPYVASPTTGATVTDTHEDGGITDISDNNVAGDPKISYTSALNPAKSVDLLWAVNSTYTASGSGYTGPNETEWYGEAGKPYLNMDKMTTDGKVTFDFKHALTRLGITVQGMFDKVNDKGSLTDKSTDGVKDGSIIMIESITLDGPYRWKGTLNLNNTTANEAKWENPSATRAAGDKAKIELVNETAEGKHVIADAIKYVSSNKAVDYTSSYGVTKERRDVFTGVTYDSSNPTTGRNFYMLVPQEATGELTVRIVYHIITDDARLDGGKIDITNDITQTLASGTLQFTSGKANELNLVLGLTTVKMEADVSNWPTATSKDVDLPINN